MFIVVAIIGLMGSAFVLLIKFGFAIFTKLCYGLFGLISKSVEKATKEITKGIDK